jgi:hypothetical protein
MVHESESSPNRSPQIKVRIGYTKGTSLSQKLKAYSFTAEQRQVSHTPKSVIYNATIEAKERTLLELSRDEDVIFVELDSD